MMVAIVRDIRFHLDPYTHVVSYAERAKNVTDAYNSRQTHGDIKAVIVDSTMEAEGMLRSLLRKYLDQVFMHDKQFSYDDFTFTIYYSPVEDGAFWLIPSYVTLGEFKA